MEVDWVQEFETVGQSLRLGMVAQGCAALVPCLDQLESLLPELRPELTHLILAHMGKALAAQERNDYLLVADLLEYEIAPLLKKL